MSEVSDFVLNTIVSKPSAVAPIPKQLYAEVREQTNK
jgi:hypothetical protein